MDKGAKYLGEKRVGILGGRNPGDDVGASGPAVKKSAFEANKPVRETEAERRARLIKELGLDDEDEEEDDEPRIWYDTDRFVTLNEGIAAIAAGYINATDEEIFREILRQQDIEDGLIEADSVRTFDMSRFESYGPDVFYDIVGDPDFDYDAVEYYDDDMTVEEARAIIAAAEPLFRVDDVEPVSDGSADNEAQDVSIEGSADQLVGVEVIAVEDDEVRGLLVSDDVEVGREDKAPDIQVCEDGRIVTTPVDVDPGALSTVFESCRDLDESDVDECVVQEVESSVCSFWEDEAPDILVDRVVTTPVDIDPGDLTAVPGYCYLDGVDMDKRMALAAKLSTYPSVLQLIASGVRGRVVGEGPVRHFSLYDGLPLDDCPPDILVGDGEPVQWVSLRIGPIDDDKPVLGTFGLAGTVYQMSVEPHFSTFFERWKFKPMDCGVVCALFKDGDLYVEYRVGPDKFTRKLACPTGAPQRVLVPLSAGDTSMYGWSDADDIVHDVSFSFDAIEVFADEVFDAYVEVTLRRGRPLQYMQMWAMNEPNICVQESNRLGVRSQCTVLKVFSENRRVHVIADDGCQSVLWALIGLDLDEMEGSLKLTIGRRAVVGDLVFRCVWN
jgi:hypothetical protein